MNDFSYSRNLGRLLGVTFNVLNVAAHNPSRLSEALGKLEDAYNEIEHAHGLEGLKFTVNKASDTSIGHRAGEVG